MTSEPTAAEVADLLFRASRELRATRRSKLWQECQSLAGRLQQPPAPTSAAYRTPAERLAAMDAGGDA